MNGTLVADRQVVIPTRLVYSDEPNAVVEAIFPGELVPVGFDFREQLAANTADRSVAPLSLTEAFVAGAGVEVLRVTFGPGGVVVAWVAGQEGRHVLTAHITAGGVTGGEYSSQLSLVLPIADSLSAFTSTDLACCMTSSDFHAQPEAVFDVHSHAESVPDLHAQPDAL